MLRVFQYLKLRKKLSATILELVKHGNKAEGLINTDLQYVMTHCFQQDVETVSWFGTEATGPNSAILNSIGDGDAYDLIAHVAKKHLYRVIGEDFQPMTDLEKLDKVRELELEFYPYEMIMNMLDNKSWDE